MTVESAIFDALTGLVSGRVYPDVAPARLRGRTSCSSRSAASRRNTSTARCRVAKQPLPDSRLGRFANICCCARAIGRTGNRHVCRIPGSAGRRACWRLRGDTKLYGHGKIFDLVRQINFTGRKANKQAASGWLFARPKRREAGAGKAGPLTKEHHHVCTTSGRRYRPHCPPLYGSAKPSLPSPAQARPSPHRRRTA